MPGGGGTDGPSPASAVVTEDVGIWLAGRLKVHSHCKEEGENCRAPTEIIFSNLCNY